MLLLLCVLTFQCFRGTPVSPYHRSFTDCNQNYVSLETMETTNKFLVTHIKHVFRHYIFFKILLVILYQLVLALRWDTFTNRSKAVLLLWIISCYLRFVFVMLPRLFVAALWPPAGDGLTFWLLFVMFNCTFDAFPCSILGQVWYLIVLIPDLCPLSYFVGYLSLVFR